MKHINNLVVFICFLFCANNAFAQLPETDNDVFVTNELTINTDKLEFSPTFYEDGILFISTKPASRKYKVKDKRINKNIMSIFNARRGEDGKLMKPEPFAIELLSTVHEGPLTFDRTADNIYFTRNNSKNNRRVKGKDGIVKLQIYSAESNSSVWQNVQKLSFNDNDSNAAHPSISVNNDQLFFASDRPGGFGGMDLYVSYKTGEDWGEPINLGAKINTDKDEVFPFIHADGTLYFASAGNAGKGGLDLFSSVGEGSEWEIPTNLGTPFNSEKDDFGLIIDRDKKNGYFSSNRGGGLGEDDIYSFFSIEGLKKNEEPVEEIVKNIIVNVTDDATGEIIPGAKITYMKLDETTLGNAINDLSALSGSNDLVLKVPLDENSLSGLTDEGGSFPMTINQGNYVLKVEQEGYEPKQIAVNSTSEVEVLNVSLLTASIIADNGGSEINPDSGAETSTSANSGNGEGSSGSIITGEPIYDENGNLINLGSSEIVSSTIGEGSVIELTSIYYNFNESNIRPDARKDLDALYDFLISYPDVEIELSSHTDSRGTDRYNKRLSQKRAEQAVNYLVSKGVSRSRVTPQGYGETQIRNGCSDDVECSETEHQYNRRTEVTITKMTQPITVKFINNSPEFISEAPTSIQSKKYRGSSGSGGSTINVQPSNTNVNVDSSNSKDPNYNPEGRYQVLAGAFSSIKNAEGRLEKVRSLGYNNSDIIQFGSSGLFHVIVGRYDNSKSATDTVKRLKRKRVKSYIKGN